MGAGASSGVASALSAASQDEIQNAFGSLEAGEKKKLMDALAVANGASSGGLKVFQCKPSDSEAPTKAMDGAKMWMNKTEDGRTFNTIKLEPGFDWLATVKPLLPGNPDWCPATHFGYLESGCMGVKMQDGTEYKINAGETYCVPPGHLPVIEEPTVMIEFSQDQTYTNKAYVEGLKPEEKPVVEGSGEAKPEETTPVAPGFFQCKPCDTGEPTKKMDGIKMFITKGPDGRQVSRALIEKGMDWTKTVKPILPGCPDWCPATHFGYLESGQMDIKMKDGSTATITPGESYFVPPGHLPEFSKDTVFVEFSQDQTYTNKAFIEKEAPKAE